MGLPVAPLLVTVATPIKYMLIEILRRNVCALPFHRGQKYHDFHLQTNIAAGRTRRNTGSLKFSALHVNMAAILANRITGSRKFGPCG
ncbi:hypothetical protein B0H13DRAFT_2021031 [Mycena leptocephala]|nr:hypothetical protein B0H13DRAFT_2021031 [Mycena leptocephala]